MKKLNILFTLCALLSVVTAYIIQDANRNFDSEWNEWKYEQNKQYESKEEDLDRKEIFIENLLYIETFNKEDHSFTLGLNQLADLTNYEYREKYLTKITDEELLPINDEMYHKFDSIDWRTKGCVGAIKDQGSCKCGWAFSATGVLEGQYAIDKGGFEVLSEQQILDCSTSFGNNGCYGGSVADAYRYWQRYHEERGSAYPYEASCGKCRYDAIKGIVPLVGNYTFIPACCRCVMEALHMIGPISVGFDASQKSFQLYRDGVYSDDHCSGYYLNHAVLIVAYYQPEDYYWVKNSYGGSWGVSGNFKIKPSTNMCGICQQGSYPTLRNE